MFLVRMMLAICPLFLCGNSNEVHAILLAGGGGTRLWPASRDEFPKQFIDFGTGESLLQQTVRRLLGLPHLAEIVIATSERYEPLVRAQIEKFSGNITILIEPCRRNTAPAIAYAAKYLAEVQKIDPEAPILVVPADHFIEPQEEWVNSIETVLPTVKSGQIVTFGIHPTKPETGFGYLEMGSPFDPFTFEVKRFIEKPNLERAKELIQSDRVFWNSGIFAFSLKTFWGELQRYSPEIFRLSSGTFSEMETAFSQMPDISIDFAVMEKTKRIAACPLQITWSDIGSWDGLYEVLQKNEYGNALRGNVVEIESKNNLIFSNKRLIATIGVEDLLIVETEEAIFICKKGESQKIKALAKKISEDLK